EYFKNLDPQLLLSTWLNELDLVHQRQVELFANTESNNALLTKLFKELDSYVGVPFKRGDLHEFYDRFLRLQKALHDPEVKTYHDLLMRVEPRLGKRYGELRHNPNKYPEDLYKKFKVIDGKYFSETMGTLTSGKDTLGGKGISEKEVLEDIIKRDRHYTPKLALKELERRVDEMAKMEISSLLQAQEGNIEAFASEEFRNKFFKDLDFNHAKLDKEGKTYGPVSVNTQQALLKGLTPYELHDLTLMNCQAFTTPILEKQLKIQGLTHVTLRGCSGVTSQVPTYLSGQCSGLVHLDLSQCGNLKYVVGRNVISVPLSFPKLQKAFFNQCTGLKQINIKADELQLLEAQDNPNLNFFKVQSKALKILNINKNPEITDPTLDELGDTCPNLETLSCKECPQLYAAEFREQFPLVPQSKINKVGLKNFQKIKEAYEKKHTTLDLSERFNEGNIEDKVVKALSKNTSLIKLNLRSNKISDKGAISLAQNTALTSLDLSYNKIGDEGAKALAKNETLTLLSLEWNNLNSSVAKALEKNTTLKRLNLDYNKIGNEGVMNLAQNTTITTLSLVSNYVDDEATKTLAGNTTLLWLNLHNSSKGSRLLYGNNISDEGAKTLAKNTTLTWLNLSGNKIGDEGARALSQNTTLIELDLWSNKISDEGAKALAKNTTLTSLKIGWNNVSDSGSKALAKNTTLTSLDLSSLDISLSKISSTGVQAFLQNRTLTLLNLNGNNIKDEGARVLSKNTTLISLALRNNKIGNEGAKALAQNITLIKLDLRDNNIKAEGAKALAQSMTLISLKLSPKNFFQEILTNSELFSNINEKSMTLIDEMLERNKKRKEEEEKNKNKNNENN
ncbi:MAG: hypothetical protein KBD90_06295, partial [Alphaproteobacteria bacterium]|nr:hypothetical protein [Alphaproteobacteria bacterium]